MNKQLYIVATPIGNLSDITIRAVETLENADIIIAEDTRVSLKLLNHLAIKKPIYSFHERSKPEAIPGLFEKITEGGCAALICDAGTPGISDPGGRIIEEALKVGINVVPIPGPSALTTALSVYGKKIPGFCFIGFIPKKGKTKTLELIEKSDYPVIFYESPNRIKKVLNILLSEIGDREVCVCRELTKKFETIYRGTISEVIPQIKEKGEFVVIITGNPKSKVKIYD